MRLFHPSRRPVPCVPALLLPLFLLACREEGVRHYRVDKTGPAPVADPAQGDAPALPEGHPPLGSGAEGSAPAAPAAPGDVAAPPHPTGPGTLQWTLPKGWTEATGSGMRFATLKAPGADLDISVVVLSGAAGGEVANVNRWRNQISLPPLDEAGVAKARKVVTSKAGKVALFDFTSESAGKRMVAGLLSTPDGNTWFLKMVGEPAAVAKAQPQFARFLESLRLG
ncbi:MAG TPA: hypothetical protein VJ600_00640 [Holophagaceae bacterium]|nr:hypothetical protein [Holophagaceae bacterium]